MSVGAPAGTHRGNSSVSAKEAAARRAEEAAQRAAEAARKAAEAARKAAETAQKTASTFEDTQHPRDFEKVLGLTPQRQDAGSPQGAEASSLLTENHKDGKVNCLDLAADWVDKASPELRARSEMVFLQDKRSGAEGDTGHVVVRQGDRILDPSTNKSYENMEAFQAAQPQYQEAGRLRATQAAKVFSTPPDSPERKAALEAAGISPSVARMKLADQESDPVKKADKAYEQFRGKVTAYGNTGAEAIAFADAVKQGQNDPKFMAQLIHRAKEDKILDKLIGPSGSRPGLFEKDPKTGAYDPKSKDLREPIVKALQAGVAQGTVSPQELASLAAQGPNSSQANAVAEVGTPERARLALAQSSFDQAHQAASQKNEQLAKLTANFGAALTPQQQEALIESFRKDPANKAVYDEESRQAKAVVQQLKDNQSALLREAARNPAARQQLYQSLKTITQDGRNALSDTPSGEVALSYVKEIKSNPELKAAFDAEFKDFDTEITEPAATKLGSELLAANPEDPKGALEKLKDKLLEFAKATGDFTSTKGKALLDIPDGLLKIKAAFSRAADGNTTLLEQLGKDFASATPLEKGLMKSLLGAGVISTVNSAAEGNLLETLKHATGASKDLAELVAGSTQSLVEAGTLAETTNKAKAARFAAKVAPGLGALSSGMSAYLNWQERDQGPGKKIALVGDSLQLAGNVLAYVPHPATRAVALGLVGAGALTSAVGEFWPKGDKKAEDAFKGQQKKLLEAAGVKEPLLEKLLWADGQSLELLGEKGLKLKPEHLQKLATDHPDLGILGLGHEDESAKAGLEALSKVAERLELGPDQLYKLIDGVAGSAPGIEEPWRALGHLIHEFDPKVGTTLANVKTRKELIAQLQEHHDTHPETGPRGDVYRQAYKDAIRILKEA